MSSYDHAACIIRQWSNARPARRGVGKYNAKSSKQGCKRFNLITKTSHFAHLVIVFIYGLTPPTLQLSNHLLAVNQKWFQLRFFGGGWEGEGALSTFYKLNGSTVQKGQKRTILRYFLSRFLLATLLNIIYILYTVPASTVY